MRTFDDRRRNEERHGCRDHHPGEHQQRLPLRCHRRHGDDAAGRRDGGQSRSGKRIEEDRRGRADDRRHDNGRAHQYIGEIDLMDAAEELDDDRSRRRRTRRAAREGPIGQQDAEARPGIGFQQEHDRLARLARLFDPDRREDSVVDRIVQEEHLGRFDEDRDQRQQTVFDHQRHAGRQEDGQRRNHRPHGIEPDQRADDSQDADREVVDQHFESGGNASLRPAVEGADHPAGKGPDRHGADEHRDVTAQNHAHHRYGGNHAAAIAGHMPSRRHGDQQRQQITQHRFDELPQTRIGPPTRRNEKSRDESPGDECADIGHYHTAQ